MPDFLADLMAKAAPPMPVESWYSMANVATTDADAPSRAKVNIYDAIGGWWGVSAKQFVDELDELDVDELEVHINSPGGAVWDGVAIMNSLKKHRARVTVIVDGLAASAASVVAMAGDEIVMAEGSQMMIHQASGAAWGNAEILRETAAILDKIDLNLAGIYARRAGGSREAWLDVMREETWYNADEAVEAGLADRADESLEAVDAEAAFDLSMFNYAGRSKAPEPKPVNNTTGPRIYVDVVPRVAAMAEPTQSPVSTEPGSQKTGKENSMDKEFLDGLRQRLGVKDAEADETAILAALDEALAEHADTTTKLPDGVVAIEQGVLDEMRADAAAGRQARDEQVKGQREKLVDAAVAEGKIPPARKDHYLALLAADEEGTTSLLASLAPNTVPVAEIGSVGDASDEDPYYSIYRKEA